MRKAADEVDKLISREPRWGEHQRGYSNEPKSKDEDGEGRKEEEGGSKEGCRRLKNAEEIKESSWRL